VNDVPATALLVLLGVIALATLTMALIQVGFIVYAARLGRRLEQLAGRVERDVRPVIDAAAAATANATRATALAAAQVERAEQLFNTLSARIDQTAATVQRGLLVPAREGRALLAGLAATFSALRELRRLDAERRAQEEEDPLFIG
jgi:hypothetical protein